MSLLPHLPRLTRKRLVVLVIFALVLALAGAGVQVWRQFSFDSEVQGPLADAVRDYRFNLFNYEVNAVSHKLADLIRQPGIRLSPEEQKTLVEQYYFRSGRIAWLEDQINRIYADPEIEAPEDASAELRQKLRQARAIQEETRPLVEAILERQVTAMLEAQGLTTARAVWPPVRFNFSDLPKYLVVSPRDRIMVEAGIHLKPTLEIPEIELIEDQVADEFDRSTLITGLGGLGVWPTLVSDQASFSWILSTIAHEWVHNYLVFHPLGWHMFDSPEMNTINETVATIVGDEIGDRLAFEQYGIPIPPPSPPLDEETPQEDDNPDEFDFRREMHRTRLHVDELLAAGKVEEAEQYMEARRQEFVRQGYYLRKLNQAYFAFHGSYATRPAASDPIGPKLRELRELTPDLSTFMALVKDISSPEQLDAILAAWRSGQGAVAAPPS